MSSEVNFYIVVFGSINGGRERERQSLLMGGGEREREIERENF